MDEYENYYEEIQSDLNSHSQELFIQETAPFKIISQQQIYQELLVLVAKLQEVLNLNSISTLYILYNFQWQLDKAQEQYFHQIDIYTKQLQIIGYAEDSQVFIDEKQICSVCTIQKGVISMYCRHGFCKTCWAEYFIEKIQNDSSCFFTCMMQQCRFFVSEKLINYVTSKQTKNIQQIYIAKLCKDFTKFSKQIDQCIGPYCDKYIQILHNQVHEVECQCGTRFCFTCRDECHWPCPCDLSKEWKLKTLEDDANCKWMKINTKTCPFCKNYVERSIGCNFIHCKPPGGCGKNFCYVCEQPWEPLHKDHYKCNIYNKETSKQRKQEILESKQMLQLYEFYYGNFINCEGSIYKGKQIMTQEINLYKKAICEKLKFPEMEFNCFKDNLKKLIDFKQIVKWTFAYGYYVQKFNKQSKDLYDSFSNDFDNSIEQMAVKIQNQMEILMQIENIEQIRVEYIKKQTEIQGVLRKIEIFKTNWVNAIEQGMELVN